ncbi:acid protease, partial [Sporormia fimetaria CBS 119925]
LPAPLSIEPTQGWDGIDGSWNTFPLRIGTPEQYTRAFISTASQQTWAVIEDACWLDTPDPNDSTKLVKFWDKQCAEDRGGVFIPDKSRTWQEIGFFQLWLERNLGHGGNGRYGYDTVGIGYMEGEGPTLLNTTVGALKSESFWLGHLGLHPKSTNFSAFKDPSPSYMTYLYEQHHIPSIAWGYTAGAQYRLGSILASLTLGGYDASRFIPNELTFEFSPDNERDLVVGVIGLTANTANKSDINLLKREPFSIFIDSTVAELYLPTEVCDAFEQELGLKFDNDTQLYLVDDDLHEKLLAQNATIKFSLGQPYVTNATVDIELPYAAFDHVAKFPYRGLRNESRYFPIRRAEKEGQFTLGRTFLQEAYLVVDWQRQNFSVSQCTFVHGVQSQIEAIVSPVYLGEEVGGSGGSKKLGTGAIIGIAIGGGFTFALILCAVGWWFWRRRRARKRLAVKEAYAAQVLGSGEDSKDEQNDDTPTSPTTEEPGTNVFPKAELPAGDNGESYTDEKDKNGPWLTVSAMPSPAIEVENTERQIFEMPGDIPARPEADGRLLSEKESMMVRERIYNGVDPYGPPAVSPASTEAPRLPTLSPSEVTLVGSRRMPVSPTTPRTPSARDGSSLEACDTFFQPPPRAPRDGRFLEGDETLLSPISPLEETPRRRFSYE